VLFWRCLFILTLWPLLHLTNCYISVWQVVYPEVAKKQCPHCRIVVTTSDVHVELMVCGWQWIDNRPCHGNHLLVTEKLQKHALYCNFRVWWKHCVELQRTVFRCDSVLLFILSGLTSVAAHDSSVTAASVVSFSQTKRYVDIWSKAAIGWLLF